MAKVFISYSKKNYSVVKELYDFLKKNGCELWLDSEDLLPGQDWELEIRNAIRSSKAALICLSKEMMTQRGYVHKEWRIALDVLNEMPEGQVYLIPVRLDDCDIPPSLQKLQWVDWFNQSDRGKLLRTLTEVLGLSRPLAESNTKNVATIPSAPKSMLNRFLDAGFKIIREDPFSSGTPDEVEVKIFIKRNIERSYDYFQSKNYREIIDLWEPIHDKPAFRIDNPSWQEAPLIRSQVQEAKSYLFLAHAQSGISNVPKAFSLIEEIVSADPYSMSGGSQTSLSTEQARVENKFFENILEVAQDWLSYYSPKLISSLAEVPLEQVEWVNDEIPWKLQLIAGLLEE